MVTEKEAPLAERMRPATLDDYVGQKHLVGPGCVLRLMIETGNLSSFILWGPPGVGKTTLASIMAKTLDREFFTLSAISSGVKDVREVIEKAKSNRMPIPRNQGRPNPFPEPAFLRNRRCQEEAYVAGRRRHCQEIAGRSEATPGICCRRPCRPPRNAQSLHDGCDGSFAPAEE